MTNITPEQIAEAVKMATWFVTGHDNHLRSPAWNIAQCFLYEHKRVEDLTTQVATLKDDLHRIGIERDTALRRLEHIDATSQEAE